MQVIRDNQSGTGVGELVYLPSNSFMITGFEPFKLPYENIFTTVRVDDDACENSIFSFKSSTREESVILKHRHNAVLKCFQDAYIDDEIEGGTSFGDQSLRFRVYFERASGVTPDIIIKKDGKLLIGDVKTENAPYTKQSYNKLLQGMAVKLLEFVEKEAEVKGMFIFVAYNDCIVSNVNWEMDDVFLDRCGAIMSLISDQVKHLFSRGLLIRDNLSFNENERSELNRSLMDFTWADVKEIFGKSSDRVSSAMFVDERFDQICQSDLKGVGEEALAELHRRNADRLEKCGKESMINLMKETASQTRDKFVKEVNDFGLKTKKQRFIQWGMSWVTVRPISLHFEKLMSVYSRMPTGTGDMGMLWNSIKESIFDNFNNFISIDPEERFRKAINSEMVQEDLSGKTMEELQRLRGYNRSIEDRMRYRVTTKLPKDFLKKMAESGRGDSFKKAMDKMQAKERSENVEKAKHYDRLKCYRMDVDTSDISEFICNSSWFEAGKAIDCSNYARVLYLLPWSDGVAEVTISTLMSTKLFSWLSLVSAVAWQASLNLNKENQKNTEWQVNFIQEFGAFVVCNSKGMRKNVVLSYAIQKSDFEFAEPRCNLDFDSNEWAMSDLITLNPNAIESLVNCDAKIMANLIGLCDIVNINPMDVTDMAVNNELVLWVRRYVMSQVCILLSNKAEVISGVAQFRYGFMEATKSPMLPLIVKANPFRICKKFTLPRTRLLVHFYKEYISAMNTMINSTRRQDDADEGLEDAMHNLRCPMAPGVPLSSLRQGIMGVYIGWILEKPQIVSTFKSFKDLAEKICEEELNFRKAYYEKPGFSTGESVPLNHVLKLHQFNREMISGSNIYNDSLMRKKYGEDYRRAMWIEFTDRLIHTTPEDLASIKASCELDTLPGLSEEAKRAAAGTSSEKVAIKIMQLLLKKTVGHNIVSDVINIARKMIEETAWIDDDGVPGIVARLFSKPEITRKTREILILHILSRLMQYISETWSRTVCSRISCEMLSKPLMKETRMRKHAFKIAKMAKAATAKIQDDVIPVTIYDSGDMSRWCQGLNMRSFYQTDAFLIPAFARPFWAFMNNLFLNKKVRMPVELEDGFKDKPNFVDMSDPINRLAAEFNGRESNGLLTKDKHWLRLISGMLQGIRQWKSSQEHAWHQNYFTFLAGYNLTRQMKSSGIEVLDYASTSLISSDDFAFAFTILIRKDQAYQLNRRLFGPTDSITNKPSKGTINLQVAQNAMELMSYSVSGARAEISAKAAVEKYTHCSSTLWEFNQMFWPRGGSNGQQSVLVPAVKFLSNCISMAAFDGSLAGRMQEWISRAQSLSKSGIAPAVIHCISHLQAIAHYRFLGMGQDQLFDKFADMILEKPHPAFGYFVPPTVHLGGVESFEYLLYVLCMYNSKARAAHRSIWKHPEFVTNIMNPMSIFTASLNLGGGRTTLMLSAKLAKLWSNFDTAGERWDEFLEKRPMLALQRSQDVNTSALKIVMNYHMTPIKDLRPISVFIPSAFLLTHPVFLVKFSMNPLSKDRRIVKHSLLKVLNDLQLEDASKFSMEEVQTLFPAYESYSQIMSQVSTFANAPKTIDKTILSGKQEAKRSTYATTRRSGLDIPVPLEKLCYEIWSGKLEKESYRKEWLIMFKRYQSQMPFLKMTLKETIESIPDGSINNVMALLKTAVYKSVTFYSLGAYSRGKMQIENLISETLARYRSGVRFRVIDSTNSLSLRNKLNLVIRRLFKISSWFESCDNQFLNMILMKKLCDLFTVDELETFLQIAGKEKYYEKTMCLFLLAKKRALLGTNVSTSLLASYAPSSYLFFKTPEVKPEDILTGKEFDYKAALARFSFTTRGNQVVTGVVGSYEKTILFIMTKSKMQISQLNQLINYLGRNKMIGFSGHNQEANSAFRKTFPGIEYIHPGTQKFNGQLGLGASFKKYAYVTFGIVPDEGDVLIDPVFEINGRKLNMYSTNGYVRDAPVLQMNLYSAEPGQFDEQLNEALRVDVYSKDYPKSFYNWVNDLQSPEQSVSDMIEYFTASNKNLDTETKDNRRRFFLLWLLAIVDITIIDVDKAALSNLSLEDQKLIDEAKAAIPSLSTGPKGEIDFGKAEEPEGGYFDDLDEFDLDDSDKEESATKLSWADDTSEYYDYEELDESNLAFGKDNMIPLDAITGPARELNASRKSLLIMQKEMSRISSFNRYFSLDSNLTKVLIHIKTKISQGRKIQPTDLGGYLRILSPFFKFAKQTRTLGSER